jgi:hypothetical protein
MRARSAQERMTGSPMSNMARYFQMGRWPSREPLVEGWRTGAMEPTTTFSEPKGWKDASRERGGERVCTFLRKWRAGQRRLGQYDALKDFWAKITTPRRRQSVQGTCSRPLLPGVMSMREGHLLPGVYARGPILPKWAQAKYLMQCVLGIESNYLMATRCDGNRCTHILPMNMPLVAQAVCALGVPPSLHRLPPRITGINGPGASTPSAQREINALRADGFTVDIEPSDNVWRAGLAGIPKDKTPPCDLLGLMDNLEGAESKHMDPSLAMRESPITDSYGHSSGPLIPITALPSTSRISSCLAGCSRREGPDE